MEQTPLTITTSGLLRLSRPLTGAASLHPIPVLPTSTSTSPPLSSPPLAAPETSRTFLPPLPYPALLIGTVSLPLTPTCNQNNPCLAFSDGTSPALCCAVLDLDPDMLGRKVQVLAWNFIPFKSAGGGLLEIIRWAPVDGPGRELKRSLPAPRSLARGLVGSVSPIFTVPATTSQMSKERTVGEHLPGFLVELMVCACGDCSSKRPGRHEFTQSLFLYFCSNGSSWHPAVSGLVGSLIEVSGLKKKLVCVEGEEPYLMRVSTQETVVRKWQYVAELPSAKRGTIPSLGELGCYDGVVTGVYMQGMVVELDEKAWLLLTDYLLAPPHSVRVGAVISVRNVHIVCANFSWTRELVLGACSKTTIGIKSFSPCNGKSPSLLRSQSLLGNFIASLSFSERLWVLLLVTCLRRKFAGVLTDKELLGSRNKEGFVQSYARSFSPRTSQKQNGIFLHFCKHADIVCCSFGNCTSKLIAPLSSFLGNCDTVLMTMQPPGLERTKNSDSNCYPRRECVCEGNYYPRIRRCFISGDLLGIILMGSLRISKTSGRLQLIDATGGVDVIVPDITANHDERNIYEVKSYNLVLEWVPAQCELLASRRNRTLSCRSIFQNSPLGVLPGLIVYVHFYLRNATCFDALYISPLGNKVEQPKCDAVFHLLFLTHKFPAHSFADGSVISNHSSTYAEAYLLPYHLVLPEDLLDIQHEQWGQIDKDKICTDKISSGNSGKCTWMCQNMEHNSNADASSNDRNTVTEIRLPCLLTHTSYTLKGFLLIDSLLPANRAASEIAVSKQLINKLLLEFKSDAFNKYNLLYIGGFYLLKCSSPELIHNETQKRFNLDCREVIIHGEKSLWSLSVLIKKMLSDNSLQNQSHGFFLEGRNCIPAEVFPKASPNVCENLVGWEWKFDAQLHLSADALGELKAVLGSEWIDGLVSPFQTISEICSVSSCMKFMKTTSPHPSGATRLENIVPDGTLISLHGDVMDVHFIHSSAYSFGSKKLIGCQSSGTRNICIHVFEDNQMVKVRGIWGKSLYPVGFGPGVNATFHRLLVTWY